MKGVSIIIKYILIILVIFLDILYFFGNIITLLIPILFGCFSAKRLNFIHGLIVTVCWYMLISGIYFLCIRMANIEVMFNIGNFLGNYCAYIIYVWGNILSGLATMARDISEQLANYFDIIWLVGSIVLMIISSILAHIIRSFTQKI